jgi:site-specific DNA-cytosine methylase
LRQQHCPSLQTMQLSQGSTVNVLALCAGVGGLELGLDLALHHRGQSGRLVCAVEREAAAAASLVASMDAGWFHHAPVWSDARTFDGAAWRGCVDIVTSGDPCQGNSVAGKRLGELDDRWLLDRAIDIFAASGAHSFFRENVPGNADPHLAVAIEALEAWVDRYRNVPDWRICPASEYEDSGFVRALNITRTALATIKGEG